MIPSVAILIKRSQTMLADPTGKKFDHDYVLGFVQQVNDDLYAELASFDQKFDEQVTVLQNVSANTTDLSTYQATGGLLEALMVPTKIEWRAVGETDLQWRFVPKKDEVTDTSNAGDGQAVASVADGVRSWEWRGEVIYISPCDQPVDLRVRGDALPANLDDDQKSTLRGVINVLAYGTTALIAEVEGEMGKLADRMNRRYVMALDSFEQMQVHKSQLVRRRFGRANTQHTSRLGGPGLPVIPGS